MILIEARDTLMDLGLTDSQLDFSARWLGKQPSYMSCVVARGQQPSAEALLALAGRVTREAMQMRRVFRHAEAAALDALSGKVWTELLARYAGQGAWWADPIFTANKPMAFALADKLEQLVSTDDQCP